MEDPPLPLFTRTQVVLGRLQKNKNKNKILCPQRGKGAVGLQGRLQVPALPGDYSSSLKHKVCSFARWPDSNTGCVGLLWRCRGDQIIYIKKKDSAWHRESTFWFLTVSFGRLSFLILLIQHIHLLLYGYLLFKGKISCFPLSLFFPSVFLFALCFHQSLKWQ